MSLATLLVRDVDILTAGIRTDAYGDTQLDWTAPTTVTVKGWLGPAISFEDLNGRDATVSTFPLTLPEGTPITARNRVRIEGRTYEVDGEPNFAWTPRGEHHVEVAVKVVVG